MMPVAAGAQDAIPASNGRSALPNPEERSRGVLDGPSFTVGGREWILPWELFRPAFDPFREEIYLWQLNPNGFKLDVIVVANPE